MQLIRLWVPAASNWGERAGIKQFLHRAFKEISQSSMCWDRMAIRKNPGPFSTRAEHWPSTPSEALPTSLPSTVLGVQKWTTTLGKNLLHTIHTTIFLNITRWQWTSGLYCAAAPPSGQPLFALQSTCCSSGIPGLPTETSKMRKGSDNAWSSALGPTVKSR